MNKPVLIAIPDYVGASERVGSVITSACDCGEEERKKEKSLRRKFFSQRQLKGRCRRGCINTHCLGGFILQSIARSVKQAISMTVEDCPL